ncbi:transglycosylase domain-containing protein [Carboxydothermus ferrireducens]|uniref:Penicillin-binding protein 1A n=1 Tax=Carboxydothermus ferrireducens DSM 11255 TaxID=1119529 RepID=A0ABX2RBQ4_9THEO|nr:penicillin-binding protein 1A [Carboxydothermus ferrireducens]NYE58329.1 penicillin-binding protein 1A [Carboxydothermus ferrireducens DSM 11255]
MGKQRKRMPKWLLVSLLVFILLFFLGSIAVGSYIYYCLKDVPSFSPKMLELSGTTLIFDKDNNIIAEVHGSENRIPVKIKEVPEVVKKAIIGAEDARFYQHHGIDLKAILRAALEDLKYGAPKEGASTITQQLVKLTFLTPEKTLKRKIQEAYLAIQLERAFTKDEILEMYLNRSYFGEGAYGIKAAAQTYFGKDLDELTLSEAALLAGLLPAPSRYSPLNNKELALNRRNIVLNKMVRAGLITEDQARKAKSEPLILNPNLIDKSHQKYKYPYFVEFVIEQLTEKFGSDRVFRGGLRVYTTLDPKIQEAAEEALSDPKNFPKSKRDKDGILQPQGAVVVLDPKTGEIKAIVGGREHNQLRQWNRATRTKRQPGSAFKPIIAYGPAIENGMSPATVIDDRPIKYGKHSFVNSNGKYRGLITLRTALTYSVNTVAVQLLEKVGFAEAFKFAKKLGIELNPKLESNLGVALGGLTDGVTPLQMAAAYGAFANNGIYVEPSAIIKVESATGEILYENKPKKRIAMKPETAFMITSMLEDVIFKPGGTGSAARLDRPVAGKTGTTDEGKDLWFVGYTPDLVAAVWVGHDKPQPIPGGFGGIYPARIFKAIMTEALKGVPKSDFEKPNGIIKATVCGKSGLLPSSDCPQDQLVYDYFAKGTVPTKICNVHVKAEICADSHLLATEYCPNKLTVSLIDLPYEVPSYVLDYSLRLPKEKCNIHGPGSQSSTQEVEVPICTDPSHNGQDFLALIPKAGESGGCPPQYVTVKKFPKDKVPKVYCDIPEHQIKPAQGNDNQTTPPGNNQTTPPNN